MSVACESFFRSPVLESTLNETQNAPSALSPIGAFMQWCPGRESNPHAFWATDFKSAAYTVPPPGQARERAYQKYLRNQSIRAPTTDTRARQLT
jgi:hypothetical protein